MRSGVRALEVAKQHLLGEKLLRAGKVAMKKDAHAQAEIGDQAAMQIANLVHSGSGKAAPLGDFLFLDIGYDTLDDVANLFHVDGERHDVRPAPAFLFV